MDNEITRFLEERARSVAKNAENHRLQELAAAFMQESFKARYSYNFEWLGRPVIQYPQDLVALQEIIWRTKPDLVIETGIAHGGSLMTTASLLTLLDYCEATQTGNVLDPRQPRRCVIGIDIDIRAHNRQAIESHPMAHRIEMIQGSSIDPIVIAKVRQLASKYKAVLVCLDSNHTSDHVFAELQAYAPLVSCGSYCIVFDTVVEHLPAESFRDRPWGPRNSPMTAVNRFMSALTEGIKLGADGAKLSFEIDSRVDNTLLISVAPRGYLRRVESK